MAGQFVSCSYSSSSYANKCKIVSLFLKRLGCKRKISIEYSIPLILYLCDLLFAVIFYSTKSKNYVYRCCQHGHMCMYQNGSLRPIRLRYKFHGRSHHRHGTSQIPQHLKIIRAKNRILTLKYNKVALLKSHRFKTTSLLQPHVQAPKSVFQFNKC